ncbi:hypothetical protein [Streptomyces sp. NPDC096153]|uniref:hypothetical protein n=1 Tax=Streptomyces sp. NPDC096153 TaxID=3155548 RepID=UPI0033308E09
MNRRDVRTPGELPQRNDAYECEGDIEPEDNGPYAEVADPASGTVRLCTHRCDTCIFHPGNPMHLWPGRATDMVTQVRETGSTWCATRPSEPTLQRSAEASPSDLTQNQGRSLALRLARALDTVKEIPL